MLGAFLLACSIASQPVQSAPASPPRDDIAVGTFNIRYANHGDGANAWRHRREMVAEILREGRGRPLPEVIETAKAAVAAWRGGAPPEDDVTLVLARRTA